MPPAYQTEFISNDLLAQAVATGINIVQRDDTVLRTLAIGAPYRFVISRDGKRLAVISGALIPFATREVDASITLWNTQTGEKIADLGPPSRKAATRFIGTRSFSTQYSSSMAFDSTDTLLTLSPAGQLCLWNSDTGQPQPCAKIVLDPMISISFAPDGKSILLSNEVPRQIDLATGKLTPLPHMVAAQSGESDIDAVSAAADMPLSAIMNDDAPGSRRFPRYVYGLIDFAPDGNSLLFRRESELLRWDLRAQRELPAIHNIQAISGGDITNDGRLLVGIRDYRVQLFDLASGKASLPAVAPMTSIQAACFDADASHVQVATADGDLFRFDLTSGKPTTWRHFLSAGKGVTAIANNDGALITLNNSAVLQARDPTTLALIDARALPLTSSPTSGLTFSNDGRFAFGSRNDHLAIVSTERPTTAPAIEKDQSLRFGEFSPNDAVAVSSDRQMIAIANGLKSVRLLTLKPATTPTSRSLFDTAFPKESPPIEHDDEPLPSAFKPLHMQFTPDNTTLLAISQTTLMAFDLKKHEVSWSRRLSNSDSRKLSAFSDDGQFAAYGDPLTSRITIFDTENGEPIAHLHDPDGAMTMILFIPGSTRLLVIDGTVINIYDWQIAMRAARDATDATKPADFDAIAAAPALDAYRNLFALMRKPTDLYAQATSLTHARIKSVVENLIDGLSSANIEVREKSHHTLERLGASAAAQIRRALHRTPDGEAHDRLQALNNLLNDANASNGSTSQPADDDEDEDAKDRRRTVRLIEALDWLHTDESRALLSQIAQGSNPDAVLLARIALRHRPRH